MLGCPCFFFLSLLPECLPDHMRRIWRETSLTLETVDVSANNFRQSHRRARHREYILRSWFGKHLECFSDGSLRPKHRRRHHPGSGHELADGMWEPEQIRQKRRATCADDLRRGINALANILSSARRARFGVAIDWSSLNAWFCRVVTR